MMSHAEEEQGNVVPIRAARPLPRGRVDSPLERRVWEAYIAGRMRYPALRGMRKQYAVRGGKRVVDLHLYDGIVGEINSEMYHARAEDMNADYIRACELMRKDGKIVIFIPGNLAWNDPEIALAYFNLAVESLRKSWKKVV